MAGTQQKADDETRDQNVLSFMMQLVQERYGADIDIEFLNQEATRIYDQFGDRLVSYFEPMLTEEQKQQFDVFVDQGSDQDALLNFLVEAIPDLEKQIMNVLMDFRSSYITEVEQKATEK